MLVIVVLIGVVWQRRRQAHVKVDAGPTVIMQDNPLFTGTLPRFCCTLK